jgi:hypothetical protein
MIDLHAHTTASDGSLSPGELVQMAKDIDLGAVAVTDHDTLDGLPEAVEYGKTLGIEVVQGVEISAEFSPGTMHILGYDFDANHEVLSGKLQALQEARRTRNPQIISKLNALGMDITMEEVTAAAGGGQVGRPHFAKVLLEKSYIGSTKEAFQKYLAKGGPAYVDKFRFYPEEALKVILEAGGLPVLAHPFSLKFAGESELENLVVELVEFGLVGLEVYYSEHTSAMSESYLRLAKKYGLAPTGGSDFHGVTKPAIKLGTGMGNLAVPYSLLSGLRSKRKGTK